MIVRLSRDGDMKEISTKKPKPSFNQMSLKYTARIDKESKNTSKLFKQKVADDLKRAFNKDIKKTFDAVIIAGTYEQFMVYISHSTTYQKNFKYISKPEDIAGLHGIPIIRIGTYWDNPLEDKLHALDVLQ